MNWSCKVVSDKNADVKIVGGTVNLNTEVEVQSIHLTPSRRRTPVRCLIVTKALTELNLL
jgi:hypothetical protein